MRWIALLAFLCPQDSREERGRYKVSFFGKEAGVEEWKIEEFDSGKVVLSAKAKLDVEFRGQKQTILADTVLTMDKSWAPHLYAGVHKAGGGGERQPKLTWKKGVVESGGKEFKTSAPFVLDNNVFAQFIPLLRGYGGGKKKTKVFSAATMGDIDVLIEDKGEVALRGGERTVKAREFQVALGPLGLTAHVDDQKRMIRLANPLQGALAELEGFEGLAPEPRGGAVRLPAGVEEAEVSFKSGAIALAGSVTKPKGAAKCPAVVLISGSGPQDRDGNVPRGAPQGGLTLNYPPWDILKSVAHALSAAGVLVLRVDDRGVGKSGGDLSTAKLTDLVADCEAAVAYLRSRDDVAVVGLVGHSEGAIIAPIVAARDEKIRAVFLMAGTAKPLDAVILEQSERRMREQGTGDEAVAAVLQRQRDNFRRIKESKGDTIEIDEKPTFVGWLREHFNHDPVETLKKVKGSVAIFQGMKDAQAFPENAEILAKARPDAEVRRFDDLDHLFMKSEGSVGEYADPSRRVDAGFLKALAERAAALIK